MMTIWGSGGVAPFILKLGTRWRWMGSLMSRKVPVVHTEQEACWAQVLVWKLCTRAAQFLGCSAHSPLPYPHCLSFYLFF